MTLQEIATHWEGAVGEFVPGSSVTPTSRDPFLGQLEEANILRHLRGTETALEVGCGDGSHSVVYAGHVRALLGLDITVGLLEMALQRIGDLGLNNIQLERCSVLELSTACPAESFDCVISQRCLINLPDWESQKQAIMGIRKVMRAGGLFLMTEGFQDGIEEITRIRQELGLAGMQVSAYNRNMVLDEFLQFIRPHFEVVETRDYGLYLLLSRVVYPLAVAPDEPRHDSPFNRAAMTAAQAVAAPELSRYSYNRFYALRKV